MLTNLKLKKNKRRTQILKLNFFRLKNKNIETKTMKKQKKREKAYLDWLSGRMINLPLGIRYPCLNPCPCRLGRVWGMKKLSKIV
jgi:hypothetical protein